MSFDLHLPHPKLQDNLRWTSSILAERRRILDEVRSLAPELEALQRLANTPGVAGNQSSMDRVGQLLDPAQPVVNETLSRAKDVLTMERLKEAWGRCVAVDSGQGDLLINLERYKSRIRLALQHDIYDARLIPASKKQDVMHGELDAIDGKQDIMDEK
ncbi:hypothetical protein CPB85DRAFT_1262134 [Mucidula mucida]|nr:hypothetical protein CPB85DRAFT_1262134 [Mucidula mucida]